MQEDYEYMRKWLYLKELSGARLHLQKNKQTFFYCDAMSLQEELDFLVNKEIRK